MELRGRNTGWKVGAYIIMLAFTVLTLGPLLWLLYSSFKPHNDIIRHIFALPRTMYIENYFEAWRRANLGILMINSISNVSDPHCVLGTDIATRPAVPAIAASVLHHTCRVYTWTVGDRHRRQLHRPACRFRSPTHPEILCETLWIRCRRDTEHSFC